jgi:polyferredoxin
MKKFRIAVQIAFFLLFFVLLILTEYSGTNEIKYPVKFFLNFNPLLFISTIFATHGISAEFPRAFFLSLFIVILTIFLGRAYCGWVCPLGSLNHFVSSLSSKRRFNKRKNDDRFKNWYRLKYFILIFILISALFTVNLSGILDPLSLLIRSFAVSINPVINYLTRTVFDSLYFTEIKAITAVSEPIYDVFKKIYLSFSQPYFSQVLFIGILFIGILLLNLIRDRFWCRFLCPLGALLGIIARFSFIEMTFDKKCRHCGDCVEKCHGGRENDEGISWKPSECLVCYCCEGVCNEKLSAFQFRVPFKRKASGINLERRHVVASLASGLLAVPFLRINPLQAMPSPLLVRPPGAVDENRFLERCVRCGECMKVCLTNGLQPTLFEAGLEGIWSPVLVSRLGYCEYYCTLCGQVCPTGAIKELTAKEKVKVKIGLAFIDRNRCLPYALDEPCIVCEEVCPTPKKAIWFRETKTVTKAGKEITLKQPVVDPGLCIGCGICENKCPVIDKPAIVVTSIGESRSRTNQIPLSLGREVFGKRE